MEPLSNFHQGLCWSRKKIVNRIGGVGGKRYSHVCCNIPPVRARAREEKWPRSSTCSLLQWSLGFGGLKTKTRCVTARLRRWRLRRSRSRPRVAAAGCGRSRGSHRLVLRSSSIYLIELQKNQRRRQGDVHAHEDDEETKRGRYGRLPWSGEGEERRWRDRNPAIKFGTLAAQSEGRREGKDRGSR